MSAALEMPPWRALGVRVSPHPHEVECGDGVWWQRADDGFAVAVVDGVGHGPLAAAATKSTLEALDAWGSRAKLEAAFAMAHGALRGGRGVALTLVQVNGQRVRAAGVGNVGLRCHGLSLPFLCTPGIVGGRTRTIRFAEATVEAPARLVLHSDGVDGRFHLGDLAHLSADATAERLIKDHRRPRDDASVLVVDLRGSA